MPRASRSGRMAPAHAVFFLLASLQAFVAVPLWWLEFAGWLPGCAACVPALRHAHEMLLGYAVAVIGGFLFTHLSWRRLVLAVAAWGAGRAVVLADAGGAASLLALAFPATLAVLAGLPFLRAARSGHNLAFAPILIAFLAAEALYQAGRLGLLAQGEARGVYLAFDLVATMILVMGGRLIPAAMAGVVRARGDAMTDRNGPRLERVILGAMAVAGVLHVADVPQVAVLGWTVAGAAALVRLTRWRFKAALTVPSLWPLQLGYFLLGLGLACAALDTWTGWWPATATLHVATIAGMGIVTATMMVRTLMLRERVSAPFPRAVLAAIGLLLAAALARVASPLAPAALIGLAALAWSAAFALVGGALLGLALSARAARRG
ncbi:MAG: NnrS family protein [Solirubrobacterales bacterium]